MRLTDGTGWRFGSALPGVLRQSLNALCEREPASGFRHDPGIAAELLALLSDGTTTSHVWQGPVYGFPDVIARSDSTTLVSINSENAHLLRAGMNDWLPDAVHWSPFVAAVVNGQAVAVCASVRIGRHVHEAGVETQPDYRGRGFARAVVGAWAAAVRNLGARPIYSTSRTNDASQAVARSLGLQLIGSDFHIR